MENTENLFREVVEIRKDTAWIKAILISFAIFYLLKNIPQDSFFNTVVNSWLIVILIPIGYFCFLAYKIHTNSKKYDKEHKEEYAERDRMKKAEEERKARGEKLWFEK